MRTIDRIAISLINLVILTLFVIGIFQSTVAICFYITVCCTFFLSFVKRKIIFTVISMFTLSILFPEHAIYFHIAGGCIYYLLDFEPFGLWISMRHICLKMSLKFERYHLERLKIKASKSLIEIDAWLNENRKVCRPIIKDGTEEI
ncbi:hypothetical protein ASD24_29695 [Paenibacillus sp. Root52]|uniref:hypothetical protein n=1 Tax=Paenibacillus sp. Root52 TaxID=1736552 RepID=UPI0006F4DB59|nr:hypothetical protein [Paenibacillus sp. Root52]KQY83547.1 hypothetical protein ASD24_29695 [Paenibacillus sp. Root52]